MRGWLDKINWDQIVVLWLILVAVVLVVSAVRAGLYHLTKNNTTRKVKSFRLETDRLVCDEGEYPFEKVISIKHFYIITRRSVNFVPIQTDHQMTTTIFFRDGQKPLLIVKHYVIPSLTFPKKRARGKTDRGGQGADWHAATKHVRETCGAICEYDETRRVFYVRRP